MTRILALTFALTAAMPAVALTSDEQQACDAIGTLANVVMSQRQAGATLEDLLPFAQMAEGPVQALAEDMIRSAFNTPVAPSAAGKAAAAQEYQRVSVESCVSSYGG